MPPGNNSSFHSSFANNSTANYPQNGMWPGNQFQAGQFGNGGGGHSQGQTNMRGFQCYGGTNGFQQPMPSQQQQQQWQQQQQSDGSWNGLQWSQNQAPRPTAAAAAGAQGLPQMKNGDSYQRTCDYVQKCRAWTGEGGGGGGGRGGGGGGGGESA